MPNVFISYVRENAALVDKLADELRAHGVTVWLDRDKIMPGQLWQDAIRQAIREELLHCLFLCRVRGSASNLHAHGDRSCNRDAPTDAHEPHLVHSGVVVRVRGAGSQHWRWANAEGLALGTSLQDWEKGIRRVMTAMGVESIAGQVIACEAGETCRSASLDLLILTDPIPLELVRVPAGEFLMGSDPAKDEGAFDDEKPQHRLSLPEFYIGKYPVTTADAVFAVQLPEWSIVQRQPRLCTGKAGEIPSGKEKHPVVNVSWYDARAFCAWVSEATVRFFDFRARRNGRRRRAG